MKQQRPRQYLTPEDAQVGDRCRPDRGKMGTVTRDGCEKPEFKRDGFEEMIEACYPEPSDRPDYPGREEPRTEGFWWVKWLGDLRPEHPWQVREVKNGEWVAKDSPDSPLHGPSYHAWQWGPYLGKDPHPAKGKSSSWTVADEAQKGTLIRTEQAFRMPDGSTRTVITELEGRRCVRSEGEGWESLEFDVCPQAEAQEDSRQCPTPHCQLEDAHSGLHEGTDERGKQFTYRTEE